ncbi:PorP/SprF family type IX secretion system membrane protein [Saccharicrinis fermentans]|uniref:Bacteroidetes-specific putative membrane protein n=1 Tax=Saccharicrinis fermentans DSM 9555 = JCM 21142 TaxID=869213 RepID=W7XYW9_9BACT|nr:type IX secretion system membrane protein PorP/SprF [Saccharicrinis fermentans]GAF03855.1 bacteroidetes-specific putative membrane protein [Saccharicrinis fermentans DSM 9555 = JCM 21142]
MRKKGFRYYRIVVLILFTVVLSLFSKEMNAQLDASNARYLQTQYFINPAYTGTLNTLALNLRARKQWLGIDGAPVSYRMVAHSPINNTLMSLGGGLSAEKYGIHNLYDASLSYAYLLRVSPLTFLSLGINANMTYHQTNLHRLKVIDGNDPYFSGTDEKGFNVNTGVGAFLYSKKFYLGISVPKLFNVESSSEQAQLKQILERQLYYVSSGYTFHMNKVMAIKPSVLYWFDDEDANNLSVALQCLYKEFCWIGASYSQEGWASGLMGVKVNNDIEIAYIFDYSVGTENIQRNIHEISLSFNIHSFYKRNKKREFGVRKGKSDKTKDGIKSLRAF